MLQTLWQQLGEVLHMGVMVSFPQIFLANYLRKNILCCAFGSRHVMFYAHFRVLIIVDHRNMKDSTVLTMVLLIDRGGCNGWPLLMLIHT